MAPDVEVSAGVVCGWEMVCETRLLISLMESVRTDLMFVSVEGDDMGCREKF